MKRTIITLTLIFAISLVYSQNVIYLNAKEFKEKVWNYEKDKTWKFKGSVPVIIDFYADWCGPCKAIGPKLVELQKEYGNKIQVYKVNTDKNGVVAKQFGIRGIPTIIFAPKNGAYKKLVGNHPKKTLEAEINKTLNVRK